MDHLRSSEIDEVLSTPPSWLVRWGSAVFVGIIFAFLAVGWLVRYPDLVPGYLRIVGNDAPKAVTARSEGKLMRLFAREGDHVKKNQHLAFLESTAQPEEVLALDRLTDSLITFVRRNRLEFVNNLSIPFFFQLGELQKSYQQFQDAYVRSKVLVAGGVFQEKLSALANDVEQLMLLEGNLGVQRDNYQNDLTLMDDDLRMNRKLYQDKVISETDWRRAQSLYLGKKQILDQAQTAYNNNRMIQNQKQQERIELKRTSLELTNNLFQAISTLKSEIEAWKQRFIVTTPRPGRVTFVAPLQEGQTIKAGQDLFYVLSEASGFKGEMYVGQPNFGKLKDGEEVIVKLPSYPYQEFGSLRGRVATIAEFSRDSTFLVNVRFPNGLRTSSQKQIRFRNGMTATGEIVTDERRILERVFMEFLRLTGR